MAKISVCAECFFTDLPFEKRIEKIAGIGYKYIEFWHPEGTFDGKCVDFSQAKDAKSLKKTAKDIQTMTPNAENMLWNIDTACVAEKLVEFFEKIAEIAQKHNKEAVFAVVPFSWEELAWEFPVYVKLD